MKKNTIRFFEIFAVLATGLGKFLFVDIFDYKFWYVILVVLFWMGYVILRYKNDKHVLSQWGFRKEGFIPSLKLILPVAVIVVLLFLFYGIYKNQLIINWQILPILVLYPLWGTIQQFLIIGLISGNLKKLNNLSPTIIVIVTSIVFSVVHYPSYLLMAATFLLAIFYTITYLRFRNLWILGLFHGWLGCFFYYFVLGRDPWLEMIGTM